MFVSKLLIVSLIVVGQSAQQNSTHGPHKSKSDHYLINNCGWQSLSWLGLLGTALNAFLLHTFYSERKVLATSINIMICLDTMHRLLYTLAIHWRSYNMIYGDPVFTDWLGRYQVQYMQKETAKQKNLQHVS